MRVQDYDELLEVSQLLAQCTKPTQPGIAVVSHSGGVSSLTAGHAGRRWTQLPPYSGNVRGPEWHHPGLRLGGQSSGPDRFPDCERISRASSSRSSTNPIGTLVIASAGSEARAEEAISLRERRRKMLVYMWTGARADE